MGMLGKIKKALLTPVNLTFGAQNNPAIVAKSLTDADIAKVLLNGAQSDRPIVTDWTEAKAITEGYTISSWVYTCIHRACMAIGSVPFELGTRITNNEWEKIDDSDVAYLIENPNPQQSGAELKYHIALDLYLCGNAILVKTRAGGKVKELWRVSPDHIKPVMDDINIINHYYYKCGKVEDVIPVEDIIHFKFPNPACLWWGLSPLKAISRIIDTEIDAIESWRWGIRNRSAKDGILQFKEVLEQDRYNIIRSQLISQVAGPQNSRLPLIIGNDSTFTATSMSPMEMDFIKGREQMCKEICAVIGIPLILVTQGDSSSYNNMKEARLGFWQDFIIPLCDNIVGATYTRCLSADFKLKRTQVIKADASDMYAMAPYFDMKVETAAKMFAMGWAPNAINRRVNLGMDDLTYGGDFGYLASNFLPLLNNPDSEDLYAAATESTSPTAKTSKTSNAPSKPVSKNPKSSAPSLGKPKTETGNPTRSLGKIKKKENDSPFETKGIGLDAYCEYINNERDALVDAAACSIREAFRVEAKNIGILYGMHGVEGMHDALNYSKAEWKKLLVHFWQPVSADAVLIAERKAELIVENTRAKLTNVESMNEVKSIYAEFDAERAYSIADTELVSVYNTILDIKAKRNKTLTKKTWHTMEDDLVRETHETQDKVTIGIDEVFPNGCRYPGDPESLPQETINCRCVLSYH